MGPVLLLSDVDLLRTAGLDALARPAAGPASTRMCHAPLALRTRAPCGCLRCQGRDGLGQWAAGGETSLGALPTGGHGRRRADVRAAYVLTALLSQPRRDAPIRRARRQRTALCQALTFFRRRRGATAHIV